MVAWVLGSLFAARAWALAELSTPQAMEQWETWREGVRNQQDQAAPVYHRIPKSPEPPALVLLRDYFAIACIGAVLFCSMLYGVIVWLILGIFQKKSLS